MAMLHPDDEAFAKANILTDETIGNLFKSKLGLQPVHISCPEKQGSFHKVYFVSLPHLEGHPWSGRSLVLRVSRKTIVKLKTENEIAFLQLLQNSKIPVPQVVFFSSDLNNSLGYEYDCVERIQHPCLSEVWSTFSSRQLDKILDQLVEIFLELSAVDVPRVYGSLALNSQPAPVLEETMWQIPDIERYFYAPPYNLQLETFLSLNPGGFYTSWPEYISAFLKTYHHIISIHPSVQFLSTILDPLQALINILDSAEASWVQSLRDSPRLRPRIAHRDLHFDNILVDADGTIKAVIDWEFAGIGAAFSSRSSIIDNCTGFLRHHGFYPDNPIAKLIVDTWPTEFQTRLERRAPEVAAIWAQTIDRDTVLGVEGNALSDVREYLRACLEVAIRGHERTEKAKTDWKEVVVKNLQVLGF
ncbi:APH domain-containing protein [Mycena indigotica]|uniref:APH domain-containing protein n=1 Tax=Mycena indigotica TaxID=2126181 RepID=A0A8H6S298_9AGAR|nr:APH domain-containing protein [Mycena indigotica]KAF7291905.1 APH domain-containing protein [Mycena indigotica]